MSNNIVCILIFVTSYLTFVSSSTTSPPKKLYEQTCASSEDCSQIQGLACHNGVCKCDPNGATVYSLAKNRCVGAAGRECLRSSVNSSVTYCVLNSKCHDYNYMHLCTCEEGYYQSKDGNCYLISKYGEVCLEEDFSCGDTVSSSIVCMDKECRCILGPEHQHYDPKENKCTSFVDSQCIPNYYKPCPKNSFCGEVNEQIGGASFMTGLKCSCMPGFSATKNRQCLARYGNTCGSETNNFCNFDMFLSCLNGYCQCRNPLNEVFNEKTQQCAILVGSICKIGDPQKCVDDAECSQEKNSTSKFGKCQCAAGYSATPMSTCLLDINQKCDRNNHCNYFNSLTCINNTCNCVDGYLSYDKLSKSCVSLIGLPCGTIALFNEVKEREVTVLCEANAVCSKLSGVGISNSKRICKAAGAKH